MPAASLQKRHAYLTIGCVGSLVATGYLAMALDLPFGRLDQPGAALFPMVAAATLIVASLIAILEGWQLDPELRIDLPQSADRNRLLCLVGLLFGYFVALPLLGQLISSAIFCLLLMRVLSGLSWPRVAIYSLAMSAVLYVAFVTLLKVPLPRGLLFY